MPRPEDAPPPDDPRWEGLGADPGLCLSCAHPVLNATRRGTVYLRCAAAAHDPRLRRHPPLPVRACVGWERAGGERGAAG